MPSIDWNDVEGFTASEFACKCGCGSNNIQPGLIYKLADLRKRVRNVVPNAILVVTSGYRCPKHNQSVSSTGEFGPHTTGLAVDLKCSGLLAYVVVGIALELGFRGIGVSQKGPHESRYIHLDLIPDSFAHKRPWIWSY